jgi:hypothetical protein
MHVRLSRRTRQRKMKTNDLLILKIDETLEKPQYRARYTVTSTSTGMVYNTGMVLYMNRSILYIYLMYS